MEGDHPYDDHPHQSRCADAVAVEEDRNELVVQLGEEHHVEERMLG